MEAISEAIKENAPIKQDENVKAAADANSNTKGV
jgi:hypothetical protein